MVCGFCICNFVFWLWLLVLVLLITSLWIYVIVTLILILVVMMQVMWLELEVEGCSNGLFWSLNYASSPPKRDQSLHFLLRRVFTSSFYAKKNDSDQHPLLVRYPNRLLWNYVGTKPSIFKNGLKECIHRGVIKRSIKYRKLASQQHYTLAKDKYIW